MHLLPTVQQLFLRASLADSMRPPFAVLVLSACTTSADPGVWKAILVNGGGTADSNYASHRVHLDGVTTALLDHGLTAADIQVLASDGPDPTPDLLTVQPAPDPGSFPTWALGSGPLLDPGGPLDHLWPAPELVDTAWTRTSVAPATTDALVEAVAKANVRAGDTLLLYTTDHGDPDGSLSLWNEALPAEQLPGVLRTVPEGVHIFVAMSQCHSGAFARPLLELRSQDVDVCGTFSVPDDRQATGCFPEHDGPPIGHGFRIGDALSRSADLTAVHTHLLLHDRGPDVPLRTSDVFLWDALLAEAEARGEDILTTVDRLLDATPPTAFAEDRALIAALARTARIDVPAHLSELVSLTDTWNQALGQGAWKADDLAWVRADAVFRVQQTAFENAAPAQGDPAPDWSAEVQAAARATGLADTLPALTNAAEATEHDLWQWTLRESLVARMGWLLTRIAGRTLKGESPELEGLLACEARALPGSPHPAPPAEAWTVRGPDPVPPVLPWFGLRLDQDALGQPIVLAVHPDSPARGHLKPGDSIRTVDDSPTPTIESVVARFALATPGTPLSLGTSTGSVPVAPIAWPAVLLPPAVPLAGEPAPDVLSWLGPVPDGPLVVVWTGADCPRCEGALDRTRTWNRTAGSTVVHIDDVTPSGLFGARLDLGGWTADAFAVDLIPTVIAIDADGRIAWRVDGWAPEEGVDLPLTAPSDLSRFPRGTPAP